MTNEDLSAKKLCEVANQYELSADEVVNTCLRQAKNAAENQGRKEAQCSFNSSAVSEAELEKVTRQLQDRGFNTETSRSEDFLGVKVNFAVC